MEWGFILAIIGFAALLQLAFFLYFIRAGQRGDTMYPSATSETGDDATFKSSNQQAKSSSHTSTTGEGQILTCQACGFDNNWESVYTYCGNCATKVG